MRPDRGRVLSVVKIVLEQDFEVSDTLENILRTLDSLNRINENQYTK